MNHICYYIGKKVNAEQFSELKRENWNCVVITRGNVTSGSKNVCRLNQYLVIFGSCFTSYIALTKSESFLRGFTMPLIGHLPSTKHIIGQAQAGA